MPDVALRGIPEQLHKELMPEAAATSCRNKRRTTVAWMRRY